MRIPCRIYLHVKLWVLQHRFQNEVLRVLEEETTKPSVQNPCFLFKAHFASSWIQTQAHGGKSVIRIQRKTVKTDFLVSARGLQSPYFGHFESCHRCGVSKTSSSCLPFVRPVGFHPMKEKSPAAERGGCCAVSICPWAGEQWGWGKWGGGLLGHRGLLRHRRPMALSGIMCAVLLPHHQVCLSPRTMKKLKVYFCKKCVWETPSLLPEKPTFHVPHLSHGGFEHLKHFCLV